MNIKNMQHMRIRTNLLISAVALATLLLPAGCSIRDIEPEDGCTDAYASYDVNLSGETDTDEPDTRSTLTVDADHISSVNVFAFDASSGDILVYGAGAGDALNGQPVSAYVTGSGTFSWTLPTGVAMDIYCICNMPEIDAPTDVDALLSDSALKYSITKISDLNSDGIPMTGVYEGFTDRGTGGTLTIPVRRIVAKYTLKVSPDLPEGIEDFTIQAVRICNVKKTTTLFGSGEYAKSSSDVIAQGDWATSSDLSVLNSGGTVDFYMLENMQTTGRGLTTTSKVTDWKGVASDIGANGAYATYLEFDISYVGGYGRDKGETVTRLYLGQDCVKNFDVKRNTVRNLKLNAFNTDGMTEEEEKLSFTKVDNVIPGKTFTVTCHYDFPFSPEKYLDELTFGVTGTGLSIVSQGAPVPTNDYQGTILLTLSGDVKNVYGVCGNITAVSGKASAETDVAVPLGPEQINLDRVAVTLFTDSDIKPDSYSLSLEELYLNDGTTGTAELDEFGWTTSSSSVATVQDGMIKAVSPGTATVTCSYTLGGIEATREVLVRVKQKDLESVEWEQDQYYMAAGEKVQARWRAVFNDGSTSKWIGYTLYSGEYFSVDSEYIDNYSIADLSANGIISGKTAGNTTLFVKLIYPGTGTSMSATVPVKVSNAYIVSVDAKGTAMFYDGCGAPYLEATYSDGTVADIAATWTTSNSYVSYSSGSGMMVDDGHSMTEGVTMVTFKGTYTGPDGTFSDSVTMKYGLWGKEAMGESTRNSSGDNVWKMHILMDDFSKRYVSFTYQYSHDGITWSTAKTASSSGVTLAWNIPYIKMTTVTSSYVYDYTGVLKSWTWTNYE